MRKPPFTASEFLKRSARLTMFVLSIIGLAFRSGLFAQDNQVLTNADVVKMVQAKLGTDVIVQQIRDNPGEYSVLTNSLVKLKQMGVPDKVIAAMQAKKAGSTSPTEAKTAVGSTTSGGCGSFAGKWRPLSIDRGLNGSRKGIVLCEPFDNGRDKATVTATCGSDLTFQIVYTSPNKELGFKLFQPDATTVMGMKFDHPQHATVRLRIDGRSIVTVTPKTEYRNEATLKFEEKDYLTRPRSGLGFLDDVSFFAGYQTDVYGAGHLRIELPLNNGETPVIDIQPQDAAFREFVSKCPTSGVFIEPSGPSYTADQFIAKLPGLVHKAALAHRLDEHFYDKEIQYMGDVIRTCASVQPWMVEHHDSEFIGRNYGEQYLICQKMDSAKHMYMRDMAAEDISQASGHLDGSPYYSHPFRNDIGLGIYQVGNHKWSDGTGFYLILELIVGDDHQTDSEVIVSDVHIERNPIPPASVYITSAAIHSKKGDYSAAINDYKKALELDKGSKETTDGLAAAEAALARQTEISTLYAKNGEWLDTESGLMWTLKDSDHFLDSRGAYSYCKSLQTGVFVDWRLPSIEQLREMKVAGADGGIRGGIVLVEREDPIWSSSYDANGVWTFRFGGYGSSRTGRVIVGGYSNGRALCVRDHKASDADNASATTHVVDGAIGDAVPSGTRMAGGGIVQPSVDGAWIDPSTHLMWTSTDNGDNVTWNGADQYCRSLRTRGYSDWRLPTIDQLKALYDKHSSRTTQPLSADKTSYLNEGIETTDTAGSSWPYHIKTQVSLTGTRVWSSSKDIGSASGSDRELFRYSQGKSDSGDMGWTRDARALCVRP